MSGKEGAKDTPSWSRGLKPGPDDATISDWVSRILHEKYGAGNWKKGPDEEYNKIKKYGDRNFRSANPPASTGYLVNDNEA